jgi:mxaJ protein
MYLRFLNTPLLAAGLLIVASCSNHASALRVCADPNNLPFSNVQGEGFENRLAEVLAADMQAELHYVWFAQRRGFIRNTLNAGLCDVVMGVPTGLEVVETTRPYYRSTYVFVTRAEDGPLASSLDDAVLRSLRIGVHLIGDDYSNPPPVHALARRGLVRNVSGYSIYGNYADANPPGRLVEAVANRSVDVAIVWGPLGGFFADTQPVALRVEPLSPESDGTDLPFTFEISMAVRKGDPGLLNRLQRFLDKRQTEVDQILRAYRVPLKPLSPATEGRR